MHYQVNSNRCLTPELIEIQQNALRGVTQSLHKHDVSKVVKGLCVFKIRGIASDILNVLFGIIPPSDYQIGQRPVCFISNKRLAERLNVEETTIQRALNKLAGHGFITFKDSANGKRFYNPKTNEKFGIDLTPAWNNYSALKQELLELRRARQQRQAYQAAIKRDKKALVHALEKALESARKRNNQKLVERLEELLRQVRRVNTAPMSYEDRLESLKIMAGRLAQISAELDSENKEVPAPTRSSTSAHAVHQYNTNIIPLNKFCCSALEMEKNFKHRFNASFTIGTNDNADMPTCKSRIAEFDKRVISAKAEKLVKSRARGTYDQFWEINLDLVRQAVPGVIAAFGFNWRDWRNVERSVFALKRGIGFSDAGLDEVLSDHTPQCVAVCLAVVLEMVLRGREVREPGGYVRWLLRRPGDLETYLMPLLLELMEPETIQH